MLQGRLGRNEEDLPACPWSAELATSPRWIPETSIVQGTRKVKGKNGPAGRLGNVPDQLPSLLLAFWASVRILPM